MKLVKDGALARTGLPPVVVNGYVPNFRSFLSLW